MSKGRVCNIDVYGRKGHPNNFKYICKYCTHAITFSPNTRLKKGVDLSNNYEFIFFTHFRVYN